MGSGALRQLRGAFSAAAIDRARLVTTDGCAEEAGPSSRRRRRRRRRRVRGDRHLECRAFAVRILLLLLLHQMLHFARGVERRHVSTRVASTSGPRPRAARRRPRPSARVAASQPRPRPRLARFARTVVLGVQRRLGLGVVVGGIVAGSRRLGVRVGAWLGAVVGISGAVVVALASSPPFFFLSFTRSPGPSRRGCEPCLLLGLRQTSEEPSSSWSSVLAAGAGTPSGTNRCGSSAPSLPTEGFRAQLTADLGEHRSAHRVLVVADGVERGSFDETPAPRARVAELR